VFEDALMPFLNYMPPVTEEEESVELLESVVPTLMTLLQVRYPQDSASNTSLTSAERDRRRKRSLDTIVRKGIIYGLTHCAQYPRLIASLSRQLTGLFNELGIESVKHLKYIVPLLTDLLSRPLAHTDPRMLTSVVKALQGVILNAWPRMTEYRGEALKGLTLCWLGLDGESDEGVKAELKTCVRMLGAATNGGCDFEAECKTLASADARLGRLLMDETRL